MSNELTFKKASKELCAYLFDNENKHFSENAYEHKGKGLDEFLVAVEGHIFIRVLTVHYNGDLDTVKQHLIQFFNEEINEDESEEDDEEADQAEQEVEEAEQGGNAEDAEA